MRRKLELSAPCGTTPFLSRVVYDDWYRVYKTTVLRHRKPGKAGALFARAYGWPSARVFQQPFLAAYQAVVALIHSFSPHVFHDAPCALKRRTSDGSTSHLGLPSIFPLARAFLSPARTRSDIRLRSSSATEARTVKTILPVGVDVSMDSDRELKSIP